MIFTIRSTLFILMLPFLPARILADQVISVFAGKTGTIMVHAVETDFVFGFHRDYFYKIDATKSGKPSQKKILVPDKDFKMLKKHQELELYNDMRGEAIRKNYDALEKVGFVQLPTAKLIDDTSFFYNETKYSLKISLKKDFQRVFLKKAGDRKEKEIFKLKNEKSWQSGDLLSYRITGIREIYFFSAGGKSFAAIVLKTNTPVELHNPHLEFLVVVKL